MGRVWHELRVREKTGPDTWVKKSKFYNVRRPRDAVEKYTTRATRAGTEFTIMWCVKDHRHSPERLASSAISLMQDLRRERRIKEPEIIDILVPLHKQKGINRRNNAQREKEATN